MVLQFAPQIRPFDAVGNEVFALRKLMSEIGIESEIACGFVDRSLRRKVHPWSEKIARATSLTIVHYSHGSPAYDEVLRSPGRKILLYHNVTPSHYFRGDHPNLVRASNQGVRELARMRSAFELVVTHSQYSAGQLDLLGFRDIQVLPYVILPSLYDVEPEIGIMRRNQAGGYVNLLAVAQVCPHKRLEDSILTFDYFKRFVCPNSRLIIVGGWTGTEAYLRRLHRLVRKLDLTDVIFTGQVSMEEMVAYYRTAHLFLCMSEHEGFCVPLIEAMRYDVPVVAYHSTAVPETLRGAGLLFTEKHWPTIAEAMGILLSNAGYREELLAEQRRQLEYYSWEACRKRFEEMLATPGLLPLAERTPG